jgi:hypothetical protein
MVDLTAFMWTLKASQNGRVYAEICPHPQMIDALCSLLHDYRIAFVKRNGKRLRIQDPRSILDLCSLIYCPPDLRERVFEYYELTKKTPLFQNRAPEFLEEVRLAAKRVLLWIDEHRPRLPE